MFNCLSSPERQEIRPASLNGSMSTGHSVSRLKGRTVVRRRAPSRDTDATLVVDSLQLYGSVLIRAGCMTPNSEKAEFSGGSVPISSRMTRR